MKKLQKLESELLQAKKEKKHYAVYHLKKRLLQEIECLSKNKKLHQLLQTKSCEIMKELQNYLQNVKEYEVE